MNGESLNIAEEKKAICLSALPEIFTEGKIDLEKLKLAIGEDLNIQNERYVLNWAGKSEAFKVLQTPTTATLVPDKTDSVNFDTTENLFIEGENLEVLKVLQKSYYGKIKMIYIDPPYNTGSDSFIYPDRFAESKEEYLKRIGDKDEEGFLLKEGLFRKNAKDSGHYHSNWLSMIYPRLFLARNLLREDGVIFVSIDDNEIHNLRLVMNEVYGEENFIAQIVVQSNKRGQTYKEIAKTHEYLLCYSNQDETEMNELEKGEANDLNFNDEIGAFNIRELRNRNPKYGKFNRPNLFFPIYIAETIKNEDSFHQISLEKTEVFNIETVPLNSEGKESCWRWSKKLITQLWKNELGKTPLIAKQRRDGGWNIYEKYRKTTYKVKSIWDETEVINEQGTIDLKEIGMQGLFDHPKPINLIKKCLNIGSNEEDTILDFFAGSATTAHAVFKQNVEDKKSRKFIIVQLPEIVEEASEAFKQGYRTISALGIARAKNACGKLKEQISNERNVFTPKLSEIDLGFKVFRLKPSNFKIWRGAIDNPEELVKQVDAFVDPTREGTTEENMLYELLLKSGRDLNSKVEKLQADSADYYAVNDGEMIIVLSKISDILIKDIIAKNPQKVIALDKLFEGNDQMKTNTVLQMKDANIDFRTI